MQAADRGAQTNAGQAGGLHPGIAVNAYYYVGDGDIAYRQACKLGCEGIVSKQLGLPRRRPQPRRCYGFLFPRQNQPSTTSEWPFGFGRNRRPPAAAAHWRSAARSRRPAPPSKLQLPTIAWPLHGRSRVRVVKRNAKGRLVER